MSNFNTSSFNTCPHCGKANALNARYCSSCGKQLEAPEAIVVCKNCHKVNSAMASFCGACGQPLHVESSTKVCPRCHSEVPSEENVCKCGYAFNGYKYASPEAPVSSKEVAAAHRAHDKKLPRTRNGGRVIALFGLIFLLVFAYLLVVPACVIRPPVVTDLDGGLLVVGEEKLYAYSLIYGIVESVIGADISAVLDSLVNTYGIGGLIVIALTVVTALAMVVHFLVCVIRLFTSKRSKGMNVFFLIMAILSTVAIGLYAGFFYLGENTEGFWKTLHDIFVPNCQVGWMVYAIPLYYWFFFLYSLGAKAKKPKMGALS